ncbi:uncharacterized protein ARMOST_21090 [Armillaria ostoyae]|uniref:Uncharacterized protein n=1 Tax=Armillaria ostoyae TaxID=47428 RepID=A0A284S954_ARMOS|nr:uncharacterized protein ARMOST_21090 [Armillaria ostoyae]
MTPCSNTDRAALYLTVHLSPRQMQVIMDGLQNQRDALEVGALSPRIILFVVLLLHSRRARAHVYRASRSLYKDSVCPGLEEAIKTIEDGIAELEIHERRLAAEYRMVGDIDSVEVFDEAKCRAFAGTGADCAEDLRKLGRLHDLRLKLACLQQSASGSSTMSTGRTGKCLFHICIAPKN